MESKGPRVFFVAHLFFAEFCYATGRRGRTHAADCSDSSRAMGD